MFAHKQSTTSGERSEISALDRLWHNRNLHQLHADNHNDFSVITTDSFQHTTAAMKNKSSSPPAISQEVSVTVRD